MKYIDIVFDGPPDAEDPRFVEAEDENGHGISVGEWVQRVEHRRRDPQRPQSVRAAAKGSQYAFSS